MVNDYIQEVLNSHNQEKTIDELIEEQDIEELESLDPVKTEDPMMIDSDEDIRLSESDYKESEESTDEIDNTLVNPEIYFARDGTEWIQHISNVPGRFATQQVVLLAS
ncbi:hypothetical protein TNCV_530721 [Trichonephila clavipes]|nr:hypothetical protein TNCV_530721 [Trichonephila clavipes]